jgi:hypothetical protein
MVPATALPLLLPAMEEPCLRGRRWDGRSRVCVCLESAFSGELVYVYSVAF